jgi:uncharacterized protein YjbJ (UPF0337 family)
MNTQISEGNWMQFKGKVREQWGKLTNDDLDVIAGKRDQLIGKLKERYGKTAEALNDEIEAFESTLPEHERSDTAHGART